MDARITALQEALPKLTVSDIVFAQSLLNQYRNRGDLSPRQWPWVEKLAAKPNMPVPAIEQVGNLAGVLSLFDKAAEHLKRPAIVLHVEGVGEIRISVAGEYARVPGSLNVAANGGYPSEWYGRILRDGSFVPSAKVTTPTTMLPALRAFAENPAEIAAAHGRLTGKCCFCNNGLKDERSTATGYGPVCARNYGLSWGARRSPARCEELPATQLATA